MASDRRGGLSTVLVLVVAILATACVAPPPRDDLAGLDRLPKAPHVDPRSATVRIRSETCGGVGVGSGFLLDSHTIITNRHVVEGATRLTVETYEGDELSVSVASEGLFADLAVLKITKGIGQAARLASQDPPAGTHIRAFGYAGGGPMRVTEGTITGFQPDWELGNKGDVMTATVEIRPGNSGGPALDDEDRVIGVVYAIELKSNLGLIVPISTLKQVLKTASLLRAVKPC